MVLMSMMLKFGQSRKHAHKIIRCREEYKSLFRHRARGYYYLKKSAYANTPAAAATAAEDFLDATRLVGVLIVTNSSAAVG